MATGHYQCSSNRADVAEKQVIKGLLQRYDAHNQASLNQGKLTIESQSDSMNVTLDGSGAEVAFLKDIAPHLSTPLRVTNVIDYPYDDKRTFTFIAKPDGTVLKRENGEKTEL